jgi:hypothetical protein
MLTSAASLRSVRMSQIPWGDKHSSYGGASEYRGKEKAEGPCGHLRLVGFTSSAALRAR